MQTSESNESPELRALRAAVQAKLAYWEAMLNLEQTLRPDEPFGDRANDRLVDFIDDLSCAVPNPATPQAVTAVATDQSLHQLRERLAGL